VNPAAPESPGTLPADAELDLAGFVTRWSPQAAELLGIEPDHAIGQPLPWLLEDLDDPGGGPPLALPENGDPAQMALARRDAAGNRQHLRMTLTLQPDADGQPRGLYVRFEPLQPAATNPEQLHWYGALLHGSTQGLLVIDASGQPLAVNPAFTRLTGCSADDVALHWGALLQSHDAPPLGRLLRDGGHWHGTVRVPHREGQPLILDLSVGTVRAADGRGTQALCLFTRHDEGAPACGRDAVGSHLDPVTQLPNRLLLTQMMGPLLAQARRSRALLAVLVIRWPRLGRLYDTLGHDSADSLLRTASARLQGTLREQDVLARLGHDSVVAVLPGLPQREHAALVAHKLVERLRPAYPVLDDEVECPGCVGVGLYPDNGEDMAVLLRCAEVAAQRASEPEAPPVAFFSAEMHERATERLRLESELRRAGPQGELHLLLQPKVSLRNGRIVGAEALLRWRHPRRGLLGPGEFVALAEETNLILDLGDWVLQEACRIVRDWNARGWRMPPVAVNVSARQFQPGLPERIDELLQRHGVAPRQLQLEVTESVMVRGADHVSPIMEELAAMGLGLALDDFGTGYSSLSYLKRFPLRTLKIDRSFVIGIPHQISDCAIARAIVTMGQQLRQEIVAEGVETVEQMRFLRALGCDQLQGYLFSPPVELDTFERMVREDHRLPLTAG